VIVLETQMKAFYLLNNTVKSIPIFGYSSKSFPIFELIGFGIHAKSIREKINFITRSKKLFVPLKKYTLCLDSGSEDEINKKHIFSLEFPCLLLYWHLTGHLPILKLDDCFASGSLSTFGNIFSSPLDENQLRSLEQLFSPREYKFITNQSYESSSFPQIIAHSLLENLRDAQPPQAVINGGKARPDLGQEKFEIGRSL
jgi:hypothetical protein